VRLTRERLQRAIDEHPRSESEVADLVGLSAPFLEATIAGSYLPEPLTRARMVELFGVPSPELFEVS